MSLLNQNDGMAVLVGVDIGTSSCKAIAIDEGGCLLAEASENYETQSPQPLWTEQRPHDWLAAIKRVLPSVVGRGCDVIGLTGQMHGSVLLDTDGQVLAPAILWNDQRAESEAAEIMSLVGVRKYREITMNNCVSGFTAPKLFWMKGNRPALWRQIRKICLPKDFVGYALTGTHFSEPSDAAGTGLFDCRTRDWSSDILAALEVPRSILPNVVESTGVIGEYQGVPVVAGGGDQSAGGIGVGAIASGVASLSLGSSGVLFCAGVEPEYVRGVNTFCHASGGYLRMAVSLNCATTFRELLVDFGLPSYHWEWEKLVGDSYESGANWGLLPFLQGERAPVTTSQSRLVEFGDRPSDPRDLFLGIVRSIATNLWLCETRLFDGGRASAGPQPEEIRLTGGLARSPIWRQTIADVFERPAATMEVDEGPAFGAAILAGVGVGVYDSVSEAVSRCVRKRDLVAPSGIDLASFRRQFASTLEQEFPNWSQ